jgi:hypothetical protein
VNLETNSKYETWNTEETGESLCDLGLDKYFSDKVAKLKSVKGQIGKLAFTNFLKFLLQKTMLRE